MNTAEQTAEQTAPKRKYTRTAPLKEKPDLSGYKLRCINLGKGPRLDETMTRFFKIRGHILKNTGKPYSAANALLALIILWEKSTNEAKAQAVEQMKKR